MSAGASGGSFSAKMKAGDMDPAFVLG